MIQRISRIISNVFGPLLAPSYGAFLALWVSILCYQSLSTRWVVLLAIFGITCIIPLVIVVILHKMKIVADFELDNRNERYLPYMATIVCYIAATFYLYNVHAPAWFIAFMAGGTLAGIMALIINCWWKISAHTSGMGGIVAMLFAIHSNGLEAFDIFWLICLAIILSGVVGAVRVYQRHHTFMQVFAGFFNGYLCIHILTTLLY